MPTVAYIANQFPSPVEPYVADEIRELRKRGIVVIPCSARRADDNPQDDRMMAMVSETLYLQPLQIGLLLRPAGLAMRRFTVLADLVKRLAQGNESPRRRMRALMHTWLGACYAVRLEGRGVEHIHVHHGYFASWIAMVAARLLGISFSMTLHGSDLLLHRAYLDTKLKNCKFCVTVSEFNRKHILTHYAGIQRDKIIVQHMGVDPRFDRSLDDPPAILWAARSSDCLVLLAVGRLHPVKDHPFLVWACHLLKIRGIGFLCLIAGEGPERPSLERLIRKLGLGECVKLLGHLSREQLNACYARCDLVVLTSRSEGIPLVLMEAMARGRIVLAPAITGIPELVRDGETGFLYRPGSLEDFVDRVRLIHKTQPDLAALRRAARRHVLSHFNQEKNLTAFSVFFLRQITATVERSYENPVLQQI
jgi:colanic acid/amylovoran biosynthesis glycosyltransferase